MTTAARDLSNYDGAPISLYEFTRASVPTLTAPVTTVWRYTSGDQDYVFGGNTYKATAISDDGVRQNGDTTADQLTISMPAFEDVPAMFAGPPPSDPISAVIWHTHAGETDRFGAWSGLIAAVTRVDDLTANVICNTLSATLDRQGLRLAYTRNCPYNLYGPGCETSPVAVAIAGLVTALNAVIIEADEITLLPDGRFMGGFVEWLDALGHAERRGIIGHAGNQIRVMGVLGPSLIVGQPIYLFRGCNHDTTGCDEFGNLPNYGGHKYMVTQSPFSGDVIF